MANNPANNFPFEPLARAQGIDPTDIQDGDIQALAEATGFTSRSVYRWANVGLMRSVADRAAVAIGSHPGSIWPERWCS